MECLVNNYTMPWILPMLMQPVQTIVYTMYLTHRLLHCVGLLHAYLHSNLSTPREVAILESICYGQLSTYEESGR